MSVRRSIATAGLAALLSCNESPSPPEIVYVPFSGDAYPNRRKPVAVPSGGMGVVTEAGDDAISLVDLGTGQRFATLPIGRDPVTVDGPRRLAVDAPRGAIYVALSFPEVFGNGPHAAHLSRSDSGYVERLALDDLRVVDDLIIDANPSDIALSDDRTRLVLTHFNLKSAIANEGDPDAQRSSLTVFDPTDFGGDPDSVPVCVAASGLALSRPDGALAFVACYGEDTVAIADLANPDAEVVRIAVGPRPGPLTQPVYGPIAVSLSPDGALIAIANGISKDIRFLSVPDAKMQNTPIDLDGAPCSLAWGASGDRLYVATRDPDTLIVLDPAGGGTAIAERAFAPGECDAPAAISLSDAATMLVVCEGDSASPGRVLGLDPLSLATVSSAEVGLAPNALARVEKLP